MQYCVVRLLDSLLGLSCTIMLWIFFSELGKTCLQFRLVDSSLWLLGSLSLLMTRRTMCRAVCPCLSPLFSLIGVSVSIPSLFTDGRSLHPHVLVYSTYFVLNMTFFSYYFVLCFELFQPLRIWSLTSFRPVLYSLSFLTTVGYSGFALDIWSRLVVLRYKDNMVCWHYKHIVPLLHKRIFTDIKINKIHF